MGLTLADKSCECSYYPEAMALTPANAAPNTPPISPPGAGPNVWTTVEKESLDRFDWKDMQHETCRVTALGTLDFYDNDIQQTILGSRLRNNGDQSVAEMDRFWIECAEYVSTEVVDIRAVLAYIGFAAKRELEDSDSDDERTLVDWNANNLYRKGLGRLVRDSGIPRGFGPDILQSVIDGDESPDLVDLFGFEGQLIRCMVSCSSHRRRWFLLRIWIIVAYRLSDVSEVALVYYMMQKLEAVDPISRLCHSTSVMSGLIKSIDSRIYLESCWRQIMDRVDKIRSPAWDDVTWDTCLCPVHDGECTIADREVNSCQQAEDWCYEEWREEIEGLDGPSKYTRVDDAVIRLNWGDVLES